MMKKQVRLMPIALLFIASLFAAGCATTKKVSAESPRAGVQTTVSSIDKYGNCALSITQDEFTAAGFEPGDIVSIKAGAFTFDAPVCTNYSDVDNGKYLVRLSKGGVSFAFPLRNKHRKRNHRAPHRSRRSRRTFAHAHRTSRRMRVRSRGQHARFARQSVPLDSFSKYAAFANPVRYRLFDMPLYGTARFLPARQRHTRPPPLPAVRLESESIRGADAAKDRRARTRAKGKLAT